MEQSIPFHIPHSSGQEQSLITEVLQSGKVATGGPYSVACENFLQDLTQSPKVLLTSSCTHALEMAALLLDLQPGDEVIMPSFTFVSAANAFVLRGATIVFVDIDPVSMNIDTDCLAAAINEKTKAVLIMHYGGVACDMEQIMPLIEDNGLILIEDAAHCIDATYKGKHLGTFGHLGTLSFHYTKNIHCGEGGCLLINDERFLDRAQIIREKGTNRKQFFEGKVDKYTWVDVGSSYLMSELTAAFLYAQLQDLANVTAALRGVSDLYRTIFSESDLHGTHSISQEFLDGNNGHSYFIKCPAAELRGSWMHTLKAKGIHTTFHYIPLHSSEAGQKFGRFQGQVKYTQLESDTLIRLPIFTSLSQAAVHAIGNAVLSLIKKNEIIQH